MKKSDGWTERLWQRMAKEWRKSLENSSTMRQRKTDKKKGEKKGFLRDSHRSSCDRMRSAEANVWRIKRSYSSQLVQILVARRQRTGEHFLENVRHRRAAVGVEMFKRGHEWNKAVETELSSSSAAREKRGSYPTPSNGVQKKNKIVAILMLLMILGHSLSITLLLLIQEASISDQKQLLLMILTCICPSVLIQEERSSNQRLMMRMLQFPLVFIQNTERCTQLNLMIVEGLARTSS